MNWLGKKNGELLTLMVDSGFELFVTVDRNLLYQQNVKAVPIPKVVLCARDNRRESLQKLIPKIFERLAEINASTIVEVSWIFHFIPGLTTTPGAIFCS